MSQATSIAFTWQQVAISFGFMLTTFILQFFVGWNHQLKPGNPNPFRWTLLVMGAITSLSVLIFLKLKSKDGQEASGYSEG